MIPPATCHAAPATRNDRSYINVNDKSYINANNKSYFNDDDRGFLNANDRCYVDASYTHAKTATTYSRGPVLS